MIGLIVLASPLTILVLKEQWLPMVPMLQILCLDWMTDHLCVLNLNILYVKGRSDLALKLEIAKKALALTIFFISLYWGIIGVCWGRVIYSIIAVYLNSFYTKRLIGISLFQQLKDIAIPFGQSILMGVILVVFLNVVTLALELKVLCAITIGIISYYFIIYLSKKEYISEIVALLSSVIKRA